MKPLNVLSLFSGIGGIELGLERAGMSTVGQVEQNEFCLRVLAKHWPTVPRHHDVRTTLAWWRSAPRPHVDVVAGGYPCQPESLAGPGRGIEDERWLWPEMARIVHGLKPRWVIGENVSGHRARGLRFVLRDLDRLGYTATAGTIRARDLGAPHERERLIILAYADEIGRSGGTGTATTRVQWPEPTYSGGWAAEPDVGRMAHGLPDRVDRVAALGNAVVPAVAEHIGRIVVAADERIFNVSTTAA